VTPHLPRDAGSRAIIQRSGLRYFSAGADLDIFDERAEQGRVDLASENRRLNGIEYLRFMELLPMPLIASVHGLRPVWPHLVGESSFDSRRLRLAHWLCVRAAS
jgi:hypothetical protein